MSATATTKALEGVYEADTVHSAFGFSALHNGISTFRGTLDDVSATLKADGDELELEGAAKVESISIREPEQFRAHVLGEEFFDAANHPEVTFRSTKIEIDGDTATVEGDLSIAGTTKSVVASGAYREPITGPDDNERAAFELATTFDRRDFGWDWQMELPNGGLALAWEITLEVHLELVKSGQEDA